MNDDQSEENVSGGGGCGCGCFTVGGVIAMILSWSYNHSIFYLIIHGMLAWFYVIYYVIFHVIFK